MSKTFNVRLTALLTLCAAVLLFSRPTPESQAQAKKKDSSNKVTVQAAASKTDSAGNQQITMKLVIEKNWYIYANPLDNDELKGNETDVAVTGVKNPVAVKTMFPPGKQVEDDGLRYKIYEGEVILTTTVRRAPGDNSPLQVTIRVNSCSHESKICLPQGEIKLNVPAYTQ